MGRGTFYRFFTKNKKERHAVRSIDVDDQVWERLKQEAEPLVDDANSVLRRLLGLEGEGPAPDRRRAGAMGYRRAPLGSLVHRDAYELPILQELAARGGAGSAREVTEAVGEKVADLLTKRDLETLSSGSVRWVTRVQFTRLRLKERGLLRADSPRGVWELTDKGREAVERGKVE
jgi:Mrr N-terminal domain